MTGQNCYRNLLERAESICQVGYWEYDINTQKLWGSKGAQFILGKDKQELSTDDEKKLQIHEFLSRINNMNDSIINDDNVYEVKFQICRTQDNTIIDVHSIYQYDIFEKMIYGLIKDISQQTILEKELIKVKKELEGSENIKKSFFSNMSHEIRTPMNGIIGFSQLLLQPGLSSLTLKEYAEFISLSCNQLLNIINDIIDISRIETNQIKLQMNQINVFDFINEILATYRPVVSAKNLNLRLGVGISQQNGLVVSDKEKLKRIFSNLIDNAIQFTTNGYIEIGFSRKDRLMEFYVKDTGIGIASSNHEIIFEHFLKIEKRSTNSGGTGLGLTISKSYVTMLGGSIWVDSKLGEGSTFYFSIPDNIRVESNNKINISEMNHSLNNMKTCLIVDDLEMNYVYLKALLTPAGFKLLWAKDGDEAIFMSLNEPVDIVLMDLRMPNTDGYEATKIIKSKRPGLPVFAQTACALLDEKERAI
jgi:signal transduction histidine kinase/CheY-like chemotaxis protein